MIAQNAAEIKNTPVSESLLSTFTTFIVEYPALNGSQDEFDTARNNSGYRVAANGSVSRVDDNTWQVTSSNGRGAYTVTFDLVWKCNCPDCDPDYGHAPVMDFCGSSGHSICKHIVAAAMSWIAGLTIPTARRLPTLPRCDCPDAPPAPSPAANGNGRHAICPKCRLLWQQCNCKKGPLPQPARVTTPENINEPLTVAEQRQAARNANGIKQDTRCRSGASFGNPQRW